MNVSDERESPSSDKRRKRVITPARREQNRNAQKAYRQRQKERRHSWQRSSQGSSARHHELRPRNRALSEPRPPRQASVADGMTLQTDSVDSRSVSPPDCFPADGCDPDELFAVSVSAICYLASIPSDVTGNPPDLGASQLSLHPDVYGNPLPASPTTLDSLPATYTPDEQLRDLPTSSLAHSSGMQSSRCHPPTSNTFLSDSTQATSTDILVNQGLAVEDVSEVLDATSGPRVRSSPPLPDPYINCIPFFRMTTFAAYVYNAHFLGLTIADITSPGYISPFYRPTTTAADDPKTLLAAASRPSIPANLQPTLPQILFPHHPCLDLLPFPVMRARAIALAAVRPQLFNPMDFKKDIIEDGLVCWRSSSSSSSSSNGTGQPWDTRTWEAKPWFREKWRMLIDGEEGDVWK